MILSQEQNGKEYVLPAGRYRFTLAVDGTDGMASRGYCLIKIGDTVYDTGEINGDTAFQFEICTEAAETVVLFMPGWGKYTPGENGLLLDARTVITEGEDETLLSNEVPVESTETTEEK